jgi:hypothetical protein
MNNKELIYIGVGLALLWWFKNRPTKTTASYSETDEGVVSTEDDYFFGGGGSGYVPTGEDSSSTQGADPNSEVYTSVPSTGGGTPIPVYDPPSTGGGTPTPYTPSTGGGTPPPSPPIVGDTGSGGSGSPSVGDPVAPSGFTGSGSGGYVGNTDNGNSYMFGFGG